MLEFAIHFALGAVGALLIFLLFTWLSGVRSFSAPFAVLFIGFVCGVLSHFVSPWMTVAVLVLYGLACANEYRNDRIAAKRASQRSMNP